MKKVPPSPKVINDLYQEYITSGSSDTFKKFLEKKGINNFAADVDGMDDAVRFEIDRSSMLFRAIPLPTRKISSGKVYIKVLLIDFDDMPSIYPPSHYQELLFSKSTLLTGSMYDYYKEVSMGKVEVTGTVSNWLRMPQRYSFYTNDESGVGDSYPRNAQGMAEDALKAALLAGITFDRNLDTFQTGEIAALFIIHAGYGAEEQSSNIGINNNIWSHKWNLHSPVNVGNGLLATTYLTVPHNCKVGVCAHELGHLAFQWGDFYDINQTDDNSYWAGTGNWDLMASGSWNGQGQKPAHPIALHKAQHDWITMSTVSNTTLGLSLAPIESGGQAIKIISNQFKPNQYFILENRGRIGFDKEINGEGLLVWRIDEDGIQSASDTAGALLIQADARNDMVINPFNGGDESDPFPGSFDVTHLSSSGIISTSFPNATANFVLNNINYDLATKLVTLDVVFENNNELSVPDVSLIIQLNIRSKGIETYASGLLAGRIAAIPRIEQISIRLAQQVSGLGIEYKVINSNSIDSGWKSNGEWAGIVDKRITSFAIRLTGAKADKYALSYKAKYASEAETGLCTQNTACNALHPNINGLKYMIVFINKK